jgi:hypothetical protein
MKRHPKLLMIALLNCKKLTIPYIIKKETLALDNVQKLVQKTKRRNTISKLVVKFSRLENKMKINF